MYTTALTDIELNNLSHEACYSHISPVLIIQGTKMWVWNKSPCDYSTYIPHTDTFKFSNGVDWKQTFPKVLSLFNSYDNLNDDDYNDACGRIGSCCVMLSGSDEGIYETPHSLFKHYTDEDLTPFSTDEDVQCVADNAYSVGIVLCTIQNIVSRVKQMRSDMQEQYEPTYETLEEALICGAVKGDTVSLESSIDSFYFNRGSFKHCFNTSKGKALYVFSDSHTM